MARDPSRLLVTTTAAIEVEFMAHRHSEAARVRNELSQLPERYIEEPSFAADMVKRCGLAASPTAGVSLDWLEAIGERFVTLNEAVHEILDVRPEDVDDVAPAWERVAVRQAPAARGSRSMADCVLCEAALRVARQRPHGTTGLLTSNKKDFRQGGSLHPGLVESYAGAGLVDLPTWRDALMFARGSAST